MKNRVKICYIAGREREYVRTRTLLKALDRAGFRVEACLPPDKRFRHYPRLLWQFIRKKKKCDVVILGFYGALLMPFVRILTRKPVIFDVHSGTHETMLDWERARPNGFRARLFASVDTWTMNRADCILLDSHDHIRVWSERYHVPISKFERVFLAADDEMIRPREKEKGDASFLVHFHGEYAPFHGVSVILQAAHLLREENIRFQIIGYGTTYASDMALAESLNLTNCRFIRWVPYEDLGEAMSRADVCLGFFGDRPRAYEVFTNKVVEATAVAKPLVTMRNRPVAEYLADGESVIFVEPGDPQALADAIRRLKNDPNLRDRIGRAGYAAFREHCTLDAFSRRMKEIVDKTIPPDRA